MNVLTMDIITMHHMTFHIVTTVTLNIRRERLVSIMQALLFVKVVSWHCKENKGIAFSDWEKRTRLFGDDQANKITIYLTDFNYRAESSVTNGTNRG